MTLGVFAMRKKFEVSFLKTLDFLLSADTLVVFVNPNLETLFLLQFHLMLFAEIQF